MNHFKKFKFNRLAVKRSELSLTKNIKYKEEIRISRAKINTAHHVNFLYCLKYPIKGSLASITLYTIPEVKGKHNIFYFV